MEALERFKRLSPDAQLELIIRMLLQACPDIDRNTAEGIINDYLGPRT